MCAAQCPYPRTGHHLMTRKRKEVAAELGYPRSLMSHELRPVKNEKGTCLMSHARQAVYGVDGSEHVGAASHRNNAHWPRLLARRQRCHLPGWPARKDLLVLADVQVRVLIKAHDAQLCPAAQACLLPRDKVRVMLHDRDDHAIAWVQHMLQAARKHVEPIGGTAREDHTGGVAEPHKTRHSLSRLLESRR